MGVEASVIVVFDSDSSSSTHGVSVELDDLHPNNLNDDGDVKSSFLPTDQPVFIIHHDTDVMITDVKCTDGTVVQLASDLFRDRSSEKELFPLITSAVSLSYANINSISSEWFGNSAALSISDSEIIPTSGTFPCLADLSYSVKFNEQWKLIPPSLSLAEDETYTIVVVIYMEEVA